MLRDPFGFWLHDAGLPEPEPALTGEQRADVVILGGGYLGMWTAWQLLETVPESRIVLLERDRCGCGPSGRNGGFVNSLWRGLPALRAQFGDAGALAVARASETAVEGIGDWCSEQDVDAHFRKVAHVDVAVSPIQERAWDEAIEGCAQLGVDALERRSRDQVRAICDSSVFGGGISMDCAATVHPARLALGLRRRLIERGVEIRERSAARRLAGSPHGVRVETNGGSVEAPSAVVAVGPASVGLRPFRDALSVGSSHVVATAPARAGLERLGWTGREGITDANTLIHYFRTTEDDRVVLGWGGGRAGFGAHRPLRLEVDEQVIDTTARHLGALLPPLADVPITHGWGGPLDISPTHLPVFGSLGRIHYGFGFTGNGVGPSHLGGRILASLALDRRDEPTRLPLVEPARLPQFPPEPLRYIGASVFRAALIEVDRRERAGRRADPLTSFVAGLPRRLGMHLPR